MSAPKFIPIPRPGERCKHSGLCRSTIYNLISATRANGYRPVVESAMVRLPGRRRGVRRVRYASLMAHLQSSVVPLEMLNLRRKWKQFRSNQRRSRAQPVFVPLQYGELDDLPREPISGEEVVVEAVVRVVRE